MAKADEESTDSFHHCVERGFLFDCAYFCLECSPLGWLSVLEPTCPVPAGIAKKPATNLVAITAILHTLPWLLSR
jgi:hypothetical protein